MSTDLKTIHIVLPNGDPYGIRIAELAGNAAQVADVPRRLLRDYAALAGRPQEGVYILVGDGADPMAEIRVEYSRALGSQLAAQDLPGQNWTRALLLTSRFVSLSEKDGRYLAWLCRRHLQLPGTPVERGGAAPHTPRVASEIAAECRALWATGRLLLAVLGYAYLDHGVVVDRPSPSMPARPSKPGRPHSPATPSMELRRAGRTATPPNASAAGRPAAPRPAPAPVPRSSPLETIYRCTLRGSDGYGKPTADGFLVLGGARGPRRNMTKLSQAHREFREHLIDSGVLRIVDQEVVLDHDHLFPTSTLAAIALIGDTCDGGMEWKTEDEWTLFAMTRHTGRDGR